MTSSPHRTVRTRLCILSDTHNFLPALPPCDILLHCGDMTSTGLYSEYAPLISHLAAHPAPLKLVIAGNHDITLDRGYYARQGGYFHGAEGGGAGEEEGEGGLQDLDAIEELFKGPQARASGIRYLEEGTHSFDLENGGKLRVYASPYQPEFCDWAFGYPRDVDRFNPQSTTGTGGGGRAENPVPEFGDGGGGVDVVMTHGPPKGVLDLTFDRIHVGCEHLARAVERARPGVYCFGHIHEGWGMGRTRWCDSSGDCGNDGGKEGNGDQKGLFRREMWRMDVGEEEEFAYVDLTKEGEREVKWGEETVFFNAAIMDVRYRPEQKPWVVDVDLPMREDG